MNLINIREVIARPEYTFLHKNERLRGHIMFVTFGGSHAYGTNVEGSDIDVRGCVAATENELLGLEKFEQFLDNQTDTTIYAFPKLIGLLTNCNPNTIELLGCRPDSYGMVSPAGRLLLDNSVRLTRPRKSAISSTPAGQRWTTSATAIRCCQKAASGCASETVNRNRMKLSSMWTYMGTPCGTIGRCGAR